MRENSTTSPPLTDGPGARERRFRVPRWLLIMLSLVGVGCLAFTVVARQIAQAAAAMPVALGAFDERFYWGPLVLGLLILAAVVTAIVFNKLGAPKTDR